MKESNVEPENGEISSSPSFFFHFIQNLISLCANTKNRARSSREPDS